ncbi:hypothetical protein ACWEKT_20095 [Nocardia takedensis]|uniref:hypothetical protein n=1 Tax=Nocardia takedensis TaxID=259390 RepID=UPI000310EA19|nr:hypothetical protein [Nocardia takedensis]
MTHPPYAENGHDSAVADGSGELVHCAYYWDGLAVDGARRLWTELNEWVDWLRVTYSLESRIKPCWYRHRPVREELTALMVAHKAAYLTEPDAVAQYREDLTAWHTQWYRSALDAIARLLADCSHDNCAYIAPTARPSEDPEREIFVDKDVQSRAEETAP